MVRQRLGALVVSAGVLVVAAIAVFAPGSRRVFIAGDKPVTDVQIRDKLAADGYSNVQVARDGRWFDVTATKDGKRVELAIDADSGRLADPPFRDADDQD